MKNSRVPIVILLLLTAMFVPADVGSEDSDDSEKILREKSRLLRKSPKRFATFRGADPKRGEVELLMEGEEDVRVWKLDSDAELKVRGFWGRLEEFRSGDRVWAWIRLDGKKRPIRVFLLADEISEQVLHDLPWTLESVDAKEKTIVIQRSGDEPRTLKLGASLGVDAENGEVRVSLPPSEDGKSARTSVRPGDSVFVQSEGDSARVVVSVDGLGVLRDRQRTALRERWRDEGLPATVSFQHRFAGEVEVMLDHEGMRWGRFLRPGDKVEIGVEEQIESAVVEVVPWRERTRLRLAVRWDQADFAPGQRVSVRVPEPPPEVLSSPLPSDLDRKRSRPERIDWVLSSIYCPCSIGGDGCTGMVYTLAGCNPLTCGMPNHVRKQLEGLVDEGLSDLQLFERLRKEHGEAMLRQHLLR